MKTKPFWIPSLWTSAMLAGCLFAAEKPLQVRPGEAGISLSQAIAWALTNNPGLQAAARQIDAAQGRAYQAKLWSNPELEFGVEEWSIDPDRGFSNSKRTLGIMQEFPFPGKKAVDKKLGVAGVSVREAEFDLRRRELVRDVKAAYCQVLAAEEFVTVAEGLVDLAQSTAEAARQRFESGATSHQEPLRAEIQLEKAKANLVDYQRQAMADRELLSALLGARNIRSIPLSEKLADTAKPELLRQEPRSWLPAHPSMTAAQASVQRAELAARRAALAPYPDVKIGAAGGRVGASDASIVEFRLSLPLPILDQSKGRRMESQAQLEAARAEMDQIELALLRDWRRAQQRYEAAMAQVESYRDRILPKSNNALALIQAGYEQGKFGWVDLLDTQRTAAEARLEYQRKLLELNVAQSELEALIASPPLAK